MFDSNICMDSNYWVYNGTKHLQEHYLPSCMCDCGCFSLFVIYIYLKLNIFYWMILVARG